MCLHMDSSCIGNRYSHVLNIPWIMDDNYLCSPVLHKLFTKKWGGPACFITTSNKWENGKYIF